MSTSMHNTQEGFHFCQLLESRKDPDSFLQVWPVLAGHIHGKELCLGWHELLLKKQRVNISPLYILRAFRRNPWRHTATSIPSSSSLEALLEVSLAAVHCESPHGPLPCVYDMICITNQIKAMMSYNICQLFSKFHFGVVGRHK